MRLTVALIANVKPARPASHLPEDYYAECDSLETVQAIAAALRRAGHQVEPVEANPALPTWLSRNPVDLAFNIAEGFEGPAREARVPALLELMGIPYTGAGVLALALAMDKTRSKQLFRAQGIPTPNFQRFHSPDDPLDKGLQFPLIVKPNGEGSGKGISAASVVRHAEPLQERVRWIRQHYRQDALVEEFIAGTELTVGILEGRPLPALEVDFTPCAPRGENFYSWKVKEHQGNPAHGPDPRFFCPARLSAEQTGIVQGVAVRAAAAVGAEALARVDVRLSSDGIPYVLEVNPLPGLDPKQSNLPMMAAAAGLSYDRLIQGIVESAVRRSPQLSAPAAGAGTPPRSPEVLNRSTGGE